MIQIAWDKLLKLDYWFEGVGGSTSITAPVEYNSSYFWFFLIFFSSVFTLGVLLRTLANMLNFNNPLRIRVSGWSEGIIWIGFTGATWFLLRQLSVGFLGARFWLFALLAWFLVILYFVVNYFVRNFSLEMAYYKKTGNLPPGLLPKE